MLTNLLPFIQKYNLFIFPLEPGRKIPEITEWESKATQSPEKIAQWAKVFPGCNWGVAAGPSNLIILDSDTKNNIDGPKDIIEAYNPEPTLTVLTPSGGIHRYYRGVGGNRARFLPGNDIRSKGGYVVSPFSKIGDKEYKIIEDKPIVPAPKWLSDISKPGEKKEKFGSPLCELDLPENVQRAESFLQSAPVSIEGNGGDETAFKVAARMHDLGISDHTTHDMMLTLWNPRCCPPWDQAELWQKIQNAFRYSRDHQGNDTREGKSEALKDVFEPIKMESFARPLSDLGLRFPERNWVVENWIPAGGACSTLLTGEGGTGKSQLSLQLAVAIAAGSDWLGLRVKQSPVLYISCEDDDDELDRRVFSIRQQTFLSSTNAPLWVSARVGKPSTLAIGDRGKIMPGPFYAEVDSMLSQMPEGPKVLFLDTAADVFAGNENDRGEVNAFSKVVLSKLGLKNHATIILLSHPPKANTKGESATYSGSTAWNNAVRARLFLRYQEKKKNNYRVLSNEKNNYTQAGAEIVLQFDRGIYKPVQEVEVFSILDSAVFEAIVSAENSGVRVSAKKQSNRYIGNIPMIDTHGQKRSEGEVIEAVKRLIRAGRVIEVTGDKKNSGLSPVLPSAFE